MYNRTLFPGTDTTVHLFAKWAAQNILTKKDTSNCKIIFKYVSVFVFEAWILQIHENIF